MSELRVADPSRLHLKKELTQIRKAARVLRDPGTTSSWKSPLNSSRSAATAKAAGSSASTWKQMENESTSQNGASNIHFDSHLRNGNHTVKDKRVFLYNWKTQRSSSEKSALARNDADNDTDSCSCKESLDGSLSDARHAGDSRSDTYLGESRSAASMIFRCRDANLVSPSMKRALGIKRKGKKTNTRLDVLSRYQHNKEMNSRKSLRAHPSTVIGLRRDDSVDQSDETKEYSNSEDLRKTSAASPLLIKLRPKNWSHSPSKLLRSSRKEDSSYCHSTPALSTSSYNKYFNPNPSTVESWDATTTSVNDEDDEVDDHLQLPGRQGCGIPCYWSRRTPRHRGVCRSCCSPSLSDTIRRKGSSMLFGSQPTYHRCRQSTSVSSKRRMAERSPRRLLPLLANGGGCRGGSSIGSACSDGELSTNFGELDLEALSRLDGRRWSSCRSHDGLEVMSLDADEEATPENIRSLSQKYRPAFFSDLVGQTIVVQSLINAVSRGRIAPVYLFQGPRGTGKTSAARIFASALNCVSTEERKPCCNCRECIDFISGKTRNIMEVDGTDKKGIDKVRCLLKKITHRPPLGSSYFKIFLIDECHLLPSKMWLAFLKFLEEPPQRVVFIFVTTDPDNVPRTIQSRCQKYLFNKIKDGDIGARLRRISSEENMNVELDALDLIALNADGSLRDAETMLDQLSLLGKKITTALVNELVGVVSDEKLLELLELAMSSDTAETVKRARDLMDSGTDPMVLMSQLATLIMDIIAGTLSVVDTKYNDSFFGSQNLTEAELERLKHALKLLSDAEKQLRVSSDRSTWFTATLLQLGSVPSPEVTQSSCSRRQSSRTTEEDPSSASRESITYKQKLDDQYLPHRSSPHSSLYRAINGDASLQGGYGLVPNLPQGPFMDNCTSTASQDDQILGNFLLRYRNSDKLDDIWERCIDKCHSNTLRQLLHTHGKLLSISEVEGVLVVYIAFGDENIKARAERFLSSITNSIEMVLRHNVEVRIILLSDCNGLVPCANQNDLKGRKRIEATLEKARQRKGNCSGILPGYFDLDSQEDSLELSRGSFSEMEGKLKGGPAIHSKSSTLDDGFQDTVLSPELLAEGNAENGVVKEGRQDLPIQRIESIIREQRLETAWLQAAEKGGTPGSLSRSKPEKNQVLPQEDTYNNNEAEPITSVGEASQLGEDELNHECKVLDMQDRRMLQKDQIGHYPMSPSLLHNTSFVNGSKESLGYESGSAGGCSGLFCWNSCRPQRKKAAKGTPVRSGYRSGPFSLFGECVKQKKTERRRSIR